MVQLKVVHKVIEDYINTDFNSSMVQLKELKVITGWVLPTFQFLYGTIKSLTNLHYRSYFFKFQFLYGTIKR